MLKKITAVLTAVILVAALSISAFATEVDISAQKWTDGGDVVQGISTGLVGIDLPFEVKAGETVTVHAVGSSDGDFRVWLGDDSQSTLAQSTEGALWYASTNGGFTAGDFDLTFDLVCTDVDGKGVDTATCIIFKGPSYNTNLDNFKLVSLTVSKESEEEAPADTAPADDAEPETPPEDSAADNASSESEAPDDTAAEEPEASPDTGAVFMLLPVAISMAAVVFGKKRS